MPKLFLITFFCMFLLACHEDWRECLTRCQAEPEVGDCDAAIPKYYWDPVDEACKVFAWGGCGGVVPFETMEECEECNCANPE